MNYPLLYLGGALEIPEQQKQEHKVSYRCSLPSPLQKGSKDWEVLIRLIHKWDHAIYQKLPKIWNHDISLPALQHIMTHEKSFVTFYMDTHFQNHCMIFTMHDSLQVASDSVSSPHRFFNSLILCAAFCFSSFLIWALIAFNSRESFFLPNPWIPSAMVMAMSIYRTLCVLVCRLMIHFFNKWDKIASFVLGWSHLQLIFSLKHLHHVSHVTDHTENHKTAYKNGVGFVQLGTVSSTAVGCQIHYGLHF